MGLRSRDMLSCCQCQELREPAAFSNKQRKKLPGARRCRACVEATNDGVASAGFAGVVPGQASAPPSAQPHAGRAPAKPPSSGAEASGAAAEAALKPRLTQKPRQSSFVGAGLTLLGVAIVVAALVAYSWQDVAAGIDVTVIGQAITHLINGSGSAAVNRSKHLRRQDRVLGTPQTAGKEHRLASDLDQEAAVTAKAAREEAESHRRTQEEATARRQAEEEETAKRRAEEGEMARRRAEAEAAAQAALEKAELAAARADQEEAERRKRAEEEEQARRRAEEEEAAALAALEEAGRGRLAEEERERLKLEELERKRAWRQRILERDQELEDAGTRAQTLFAACCVIFCALTPWMQPQHAALVHSK